MTSITIDPNAWLSPLAKAKKGRPLRGPVLLWSRAGRIVLAERLRLNTQRIVASRLPARALSNVWWPVRLRSDDDERKDKALALWLNSTLGLVLLIAHRVPTEGPWVSFKKPVLERMPVLDVAALGDDALTLLAAKFDEVSKKILDPIPNLAHDTTRREIDETFMKILQLPDTRVVAEMVAREPIVANMRIQPTGVSSTGTDAAAIAVSVG